MWECKSISRGGSIRQTISGLDGVSALPETERQRTPEKSLFGPPHPLKRRVCKINGKTFDMTRAIVYIHIMTTKLDLFTMENCVCSNLRSVTRAVTRVFDAQVRRMGIRPTQTPILCALHAKDVWGMAELSECLGLERTTLLRNLRPLQREGLVRARGGGRGGHVELEITEKGRAALAKVLPAWRSAQERVVAVLGRERWSSIIRDLEKAATKLKE
jgi:DNA-binding MarR family transcriptional regulator